MTCNGKIEQTGTSYPKLQKTEKKDDNTRKKGKFIEEINSFLQEKQWALIAVKKIQFMYRENILIDN